MNILGTTAVTLIGTGILILLLCAGIAVIVAARKGLIDVKIHIGLHLGRRPPS